MYNDMFITSALQKRNTLCFYLYEFKWTTVGKNIYET